MDTTILENRNLTTITHHTHISISKSYTDYFPQFHTSSETVSSPYPHHQFALVQVALSTGCCPRRSLGPGSSQRKRFNSRSRLGSATVVHDLSWLPYSPPPLRHLKSLGSFLFVLHILSMKTCMRYISDTYYCIRIISYDMIDCYTSW